MVVKKCTSLAVIAFLSSASCLSTSLHAHPVERLTITAVGLTDESLKDENARRACRKFRPTHRQLVSFFTRAKPPQNLGALLHERYSACAAEGWIKFRDGTSGQWVLKSSGVAWVIFDGGETLHLFRRRNRWHDPYACTYGLGDEGEC